MKKAISLACAMVAPLVFSQSASAEFDYMGDYSSFKRFSVSAGWLHAAPQGNPTPIQNSTVAYNGIQAQNGSVMSGTVKENLDPRQSAERIKKIEDSLNLVTGNDDTVDLASIGDGEIPGSTAINGLGRFATPGTGLKADRTDTVGLLFNYHINENWSIETKAGIPPTVDILGKGTVIAPFEGTVSPGGAAGAFLGDFDIAKDIKITDMTQGSGGVASSARAWLPAAEVHYQIGKPGVNKLRPYVGVGLIYAYFDDIKLDSGIKNDLVAAGHQIQNIKDGKAGASLENKVSDSGMYIDVEADTAFAPLFTVGATYDITDDWFAVGSISYAELDSDTTITVKNDAGEKLIKAVSTIDIDPYISYVGIGYRF